MEIKQLEYFLAVCSKGSINKAAECLYTTQPNVSKVISGLEHELGRNLFNRTNKGVELTPYGKTIQQYAEVVLKNINLISSLVSPANGKRFSIATFRSDIISKILTEFFYTYGNKVLLEHHQGSVEEIADKVKSGIAEIGIVYVMEKQMNIFRHILAHKQLNFTTLGKRPICVYVGKKNPYYHRESISAEELKSMRFIRDVKDFFALEQHLERMNIKIKDRNLLKDAVYTNSDITIWQLLLDTDLCRIGMNSNLKKYENYNIKALFVKDMDMTLNIGYIQSDGQVLSDFSRWFIQKFTKTL